MISSNQVLGIIRPVISPSFLAAYSVKLICSVILFSSVCVLMNFLYPFSTLVSCLSSQSVVVNFFTADSNDESVISLLSFTGGVSPNWLFYSSLNHSNLNKLMWLILIGPSVRIVFQQKRSAGNLLFNYSESDLIKSLELSEKNKIKFCSKYSLILSSKQVKALK